LDSKFGSHALRALDITVIGDARVVRSARALHRCIVWGSVTYA
jgi:hypothetical protein